MAERKHKTGSRSVAPVTVGRICELLERIAPSALAQSWDNVGLLAGDRKARVTDVLLCIDLTPEVAAEAIEIRVQMVVAYHPPIFKPILKLLNESAGMEAVVLKCLRRGMAIYSTHTALDAASGGTNDVLAELCGLKRIVPLETIEAPGDGKCKLVVFCPAKSVDRVADALADAGAGVIGEYRRCGFRVSGTGTFQGSDASNPRVGKAGVFEMVDEIRLEMVVPSKHIAGVVAALRVVHPYEEPAYDLYPLRASAQAGIGRIGTLEPSLSLTTLARKLSKAINAQGIQIVGDKDRKVQRAIVVAGAAGGLPFKAGLSGNDVVITGELRHHDALTILRSGASAIVLGHWSSEQPVLKSIQTRLKYELPSVNVRISREDREPFTFLV